MTLTSFSIWIVSMVAVVSLTLTILTWRAAERTGQRKVRFIAAAFGVHFMKSTLVAILLSTNSLAHEAIEIMEAIFDLAMVTLLFIPFWAPP
ncbi:MAG: hypothetical protein WDA16_00045 [Candidatus Thermoplasmatota archaeon]